MHTGGTASTGSILGLRTARASCTRSVSGRSALLWMLPVCIVKHFGGSILRTLPDTGSILGLDTADTASTGSVSLPVLAMFRPSGPLVLRVSAIKNTLNTPSILGSTYEGTTMSLNINTVFLNY